ncbi:MAG: hypothetical protein AWU57_927 [Marinobacter sp. T13-3]|nr:MAG: hypothetical protein AWU57_927 [Marinobacter sp. T13-3]
MSKLHIGDFSGNAYRTINAGRNAVGESVELTQLQSYDLEAQQSKTLMLTTEAALGLVQYANNRMSELSGDQRAALTDGSEQSELRRADFILSHAKDYCREHGQPFILQSKLDGPFGTIQEMGSASTDGTYNISERYGATTGVWGIIKSWLNLEKPAHEDVMADLKANASEPQGLLNAAEAHLDASHAEQVINQALDDLEPEGPRLG